MTSVEKSREWAEVLVQWLDQASSRFRYYDRLCDEIRDMSPFSVMLKYGRRKSEIIRTRDIELEKYLTNR